MAATFGAGSTEYDDPQFQEAATHFHMGQWEKAIRILETLQARYPGDARIGQMLQDAKFKAQLEASTQIKANCRARWRHHDHLAHCGRWLLDDPVAVDADVGGRSIAAPAVAIVQPGAGCPGSRRL